MNFFRKADKVADAPPENTIGNNDNQNIATCNSEKDDDDDVVVGNGTTESNDGGNGRKIEEEEDGNEESLLTNVSLDSSHDNDFSPTATAATAAVTEGEELKEEDEQGEKEEEEEESEVEYSDDDDDSEYTYETDDEYDESDKKKKNGWFGFLRRGKKEKHHDDDEEDDDDDSEEEEEEDDDDDSQDDEDDDDNDDDDEDHESTSDESTAPSHPLLNSPNNENATPASASSSTTTATKNNEEEESILMAQAIQRVKHRIQTNGGKLYDALSDQDKKLVDALEGVKDEDAIREAVARSMEKEEGEVGKVETTTTTSNDDIDERRMMEDDTNDGWTDATSYGGGLTNGEKLTAGEDDGAKGRHVTAKEPEPSLVPTTADDEIPVAVRGAGMDTPLSSVVEPSLVETSRSNDAPEKLKAGSLPPSAEEVVRNVDKNGHGEEPSEEGTEEGDHDDDDDEQPTLEEQRSLLTLAAEHDRVDVLQEILNNSGALYDAMLAGFSSSDEEEEEKERVNEATPAVAASTFVPPPLHVAVAHGSVNVASCLLRMGADPSLRPLVPSAFLARGYRPPKRSDSSSGGMEEDRNYKKYHGMSAWELAFGGIVVVKDGAGDDDDVVEGEEENRGWFGFGSPKKKEEETMGDTVDASNCEPGKKMRIKKKMPLNIPPQKVEGIRHAFTAEALRAIGSDEVQRLQQLLNAGMDATMDVAGKTLAGWAQEMDAKECYGLFRLDNMSEEEAPGQVEDSNSAPENDGITSGGDAAECNDPYGEIKLDPPVIQDERLAGLSIADIQILVQENETLIPQLTACRDKLAHETSISQSILRDVHAAGGHGGLSSRTLLELVRKLKDQRAAAEEAANAWQRAWEEREDEFDFFWEEVLDDACRDELGGVLDQVDDAGEPLITHASENSSGAATREVTEVWARRFTEADARVSALRASITCLAEESATHASEIQRLGMSGALALTRSLRDEVKVFEKDMNLAMRGEAVCRRKIEMIQLRLGHALERAADPPQQQQGHDSGKGTLRGVTEGACDEGMEDFQLRAIVQQPKGESEERICSPPPSPTVSRSEHVTEKELPVVRERVGPLSPHTQDQTTIGHPSEAHVDDHVDESDSIGETNDIVDVEEDDGEIMEAEEAENEEEISSSSGEMPSPKNFTLVQESSAAGICQRNGMSLDNQMRDPDPEKQSGLALDEEGEHNTQTSPKQPSDAIAKGMSTAIVVHSPNNGQQFGSLPSQIWDILRRIVGLGRVPVANILSESYHDVTENHSHIMIV